MIDTPSNLSYEFYYLLRTNIEQEDNTWREPLTLMATPSPRITQEGITIDSDKRLFRYDAFTKQASPLEEWLEHLKCGWEKIQGYYSEHFANQNISEKQAQTFCSQALLGVALLINDATLESHLIKVPFQSGNSVAGEMVFKRKSWLLEVSYTPPDDSDGEQMPTLANFFHFEPQHQTIPIEKQWLRLDLSTAQLSPMEITTHTAPIFAIYGLAHGDLNDIDEKNYQNFLVGGEPALLVRVLPRLLVRQWQFTRMDFIATRERQRLRKQRAAYNQTDEQLRCLSSQRLSKGLQKMARLNADTTEFIGNLSKAIKTLEINRNNLERKLRRVSKHSPNWKIDWHLEHEIPLRSSFNADIQKLHNHFTYIQGDLTYLDGIRQRWRLHFEERQLAWSERLGSLGTILAFLVAVGAASLTAVGLNNQSHDNGSWLSFLIHIFDQLQTKPLIADSIILLSKPVVYWLLVFVFLLPIFWHIGKAIWGKIRCHCVWCWGITIGLLAVFWYIIDKIVKGIL